MSENVVLCVLILVYLTIVICENKCTSINDQEYDAHLATKTPYRFIENRNVTRLSYPECQPQQIWMVIRHGTRNPGTKYIKAIKRLVEIQNAFKENISKSNLCSKEVSNIKNWKPPTDLVGREKFLTHEGELELIELAKRMQKRLPELLPKQYSNSSYRFKYTQNQRAELSAKSFVIGLFGTSNSGDVWYPEPLHKDPILRFYKSCEKWRYEVDKNPRSLAERKLFEKTEHVIKMIENVTERLGLSKGYLSFQDIYNMYLYCAFETAWNKDKIGAWCSAFTTSDFLILEYVEDLEYYWIDGHGYDLTHRQACVAIRDMLKHIENEDLAPASFYFTHSGTILKILAHLGLYRDSKPLTHDPIQYNRLWRVSKIDAFGTNLAFIKYSCGSVRKPYILFLHQERPVHIPGCPMNTELCPLETFKELHRQNQENCDFEQMCSMTTNSTCPYNIKWFIDEFYQVNFL